MKTYCVYIPRETFTEVNALIMTEYKIFKSSQFDELLQLLHTSVHEPFSLELYCHHQHVQFCFYASETTAALIADTIYSMLPAAEIREVEDCTRKIAEDELVAIGEVGLTRNDVIPLRNYSMCEADTMTPIISILSRLQPDRKIIVQYVIKPIKDSTAVQMDLLIRRQWEWFLTATRPVFWFKGGYAKKFNDHVPVKSKKQLYRCSGRVLVAAPKRPLESVSIKEQEAEVLNDLKAVLGGIRFANLGDMNRLIYRGIRKGRDWLRRLQKREIRGGFRLGTNEISTLWHPIGIGFGPIAQVVAATSSPPRTLPRDRSDKNICFFADSLYRNQVVPFGIKRVDRRKHLHIIGKSGYGKSKLIALLAKSDIEAGYGIAVIDPHGDLVDEILELIPKNRVNDVVLFDPSDLQYPPSFNPFSGVPAEMRGKLGSAFVELFKKLSKANWSDRVESLVRNTMLTLFEVPGSTVASIIKMLTDGEYCNRIAKGLSDGAVKEFWLYEFAHWSEQFDRADIGSLINKLGELLATDMISNIVRQPENRFDFADIINNQKILLVKLSKGLLGDENSAMLGTFFATMIHQAAMMRSDVPTEQLRDFYLYVDEFHNFATDSFIKTLGEARKYNLNITIAHQFLGQLPEDIKKSLFGNIGNLVSFRLGGDDADVLAGQFTPKFAKADLLNLAVRDFYIKMSVDGVTQDAFNGRTMLLESPASHQAMECVLQSRKKYSQPVSQVRQLVRRGEDSLFSYSDEVAEPGPAKGEVAA